MNLKQKNKESWFDEKHKKFLAIYIALALVLVINQIVFSVVLKDRERANALTTALFQSVATNFVDGNIQAGTNAVLLAEFVKPDGGLNSNATCNWTVGTPCLPMIDADGTGSLGAGADDDGIANLFALSVRPNPIIDMFFLPADHTCADSLLPPIEDVYVDGGDGIGGYDCIPGNGGADTIILDNTSDGLIAGAYFDVSTGGGTGHPWVHSEVVNANFAYDYGADADSTETIWLMNISADTVLAQGSYWESAYLNQWQGDAPGAWASKDTFFDADTDNKFDASPTEPVFIDSDQDGFYTDMANLTYEADGTATMGTGTNDDVIADGTTLTPLAPADNVCFNTLGQDGVDNVIIYVDGNGNCIPGDGGSDVLVRDDTGTGIGVGFGTFPHAYVSAALIFYYYDADSSGTWTHGATAGATETLWARLQGLNQWHTNIEGANPVIEADGTATLGAGADDDALADGAPLTYLQTADNVCFSRHPVTTALEDIYIDTSGDCIPGNGGPDTILLDTTLDGLTPATTNGGWASGAGTFAYFDGAVGAPNGSWDWGAGVLATETLWIEIHGNTFASAGDANVYGYGSAPLAGDTLTRFNLATGPNGFSLIYADADNSGAFNSTDTILEDEGNVQTGPGGVPNGVIDRGEDYISNWTIKNAGSALAGRDITNLYMCESDMTGGAHWCTNPINCVALNRNGVGWETGAGGPFGALYGGAPARFCVVADISPFATGGTTINLEMPALLDNNANGLYDAGDEGFFVYSNNDGLVGGPLTAAYTYTITALPSYASRPQDYNPPALVTDVRIVADFTGKVTLTWKDPVDADLAKIVIDEVVAGQSSTNLVNAGVQTLTLDNRIVGTTYTYKIRSQDTNGNLSPASVFNVTIPASGEVVLTQPAEILPTPIIPGGVLPQNVSVGNLVKSSTSPAVYYIGSDNKKHNFPNELVYKTWYESFSGIKTISAVDLDSIVSGQDVYVREGTYLVKKTADSKCYAIESDGVLRWIENESIAKMLYGTKWTDRIIDLSAAMFNQYTLGSSISSNVHPTGSLISYSGSANIYYIDNGQKREVSTGVFSQSRYQSRFVVKSISSTISYTAGSIMTAKTDVGYLQ